MAQYYLFGFLIVLACVLLEVSPRPSNNEFYRRPGWRSFVRGYGSGRDGSSHNGSSDEYQYDGLNFHTGPLKMEDSTFLILLNPVAHAKSANGVAIANPISKVVIARDKVGSIIHNPTASAVVGPGGVAHAQSDLYVYEQSVQYLPFYGGARGQYLEVKKDTSGTITSEKIVSEEKVGSENIVKNNDENLLGKVLAANLQNLRSISNNLLKLQNIGRKTGYLGNAEKNRFKNQLASLGETASNTIKLLEEVGDNVDMLFKKNVTQRRYGQPDEDYIVEEGIGIEAQESYPGDESDLPTIAEAKPIGLAVIGEHGVAASRPIATAVATSGYAIARPVSTAIAGIDPSILGINYNQARH